MTFFYNLNKKLDEIRAIPETTHKQLNERDEGKPGKNFEKIAKSAGEQYGSKAAGERVAGAVRAKLAKAGKLEEADLEEGFVDSVKSAASKALDVLGHGSDEDMIRDLQRKAGVPVTGKVPPAATSAKPAQTTNPTTAGQKPMAEADMEEGNKFTGNLMKARAAGKKQADLDGDGDMETVREGSKPDYIDLDKDGNRKESMKKAAADKKKHKHDVEEGIVDWAKEKYHDYQTGRQWNKFGKAQAKGDTAGMQAAQDAAAAHRGKLQAARLARTGSTLSKGTSASQGQDMANIAALQKKGLVPQNYGRVAEGELAEGWDDMLKDVERRREKKTGEVERGAKHDIKHTATGRVVTRRTDDQGISVGADDEDDKASGEKRGRGRPKKTDKAPERVTAKAYKHKGSRKMSKEEIDEAIAALEGQGYSISKLDEKAVSVAQRRAAGIAHAAQKGEIPKSELRGASKEMAKMPKGELTKFAKTKEKGLPKKKEESVEETTVAGSVAPSAAAPKSKGKGGMTFGKGIYDSMNREVESMISESMNVSVNMSMDDTGTPRKNITVSAEGDAAEQLAQLLNLAGMASQAPEHSGCGCDTDPCSCEEMVDENAPDWPTNTEVTGDDDPQMTRWAGGLNKPKETGQTTAPVVNRDPARGSYGPPEVKSDVNESSDLGMKLYHELKQFKG